jgi:predicted ATPase with chaperone activity
LWLPARGRRVLLFVGPPGTGKSMLAQRPSVLPSLIEDEALESAALASLAGRFAPERWRERPFRAPHHTASAVALVGGGSHPKPGEISLAHHRVLFLDELPEWDRRVLEVLREPLESGAINISRAARQSTFPAQSQLVAVMNPCGFMAKRGRKSGGNLVAVGVGMLRRQTNAVGCIVRGHRNNPRVTNLLCVVRSTTHAPTCRPFIDATRNT